MHHDIWNEKLRGGKILIVDDEPVNVNVLERLLARSGYDQVKSTTDPREARPLFEAYGPDLVLLDLHMPHMDGFEVMDELAEVIPSDRYVPILVLTGDRAPEVRRRALSAGAKDFLTKPFEPTEVVLRIKNLLETRFLHRQLEVENETLEVKIQERTRALADAQEEILRRLATAAEFRDDETGQHAERVGVLSALLAMTVGLPFEDVQVIRRAAPLHDVGKIGIPDAILLKPGPLTPAEFEVMKTHTTIGARMLSGTRYPLLTLAREIAMHHHEQWDGSGYAGLRGEEIPLVGRIVAVADVFDSLTHERPYKRALSLEDSVDEIVACRGSHFDPQVVDAFIEVVDRGEVRDLDALTRTPSRELARA